MTDFFKFSVDTNSQGECRYAVYNHNNIYTDLVGGLPTAKVFHFLHHHLSSTLKLYSPHHDLRS